uniref:Uncharacterized protein n=1 Tax=Rhizophora mucronata TaxID=61149 RepID=A0A2P2PNV1_RHIMU
MIFYFILFSQNPRTSIGIIINVDDCLSSFLVLGDECVT